LLKSAENILIKNNCILFIVLDRGFLY